MTLEQKRQLRNYSARNDVSLDELAKWAEKEFNLSRPPSRTSIWRVMKEKDDDRALGKHGLVKTQHAVTSPALECALVEWICRCEELRLPIVTGAAICEKASKIREQLVNHVDAATAEALRRMAFSAGWLSKLQYRHGLSSKRVHGEAASVNREVVREGRRQMQVVTSGFERKDVFNMGETAFFFCSSASSSITTTPMAGRKNVKKRLTVAVCCNADGTTKLPLLFVGAVRSPRCFRNQTAEELGVFYESTAKGWMNSELFTRWLEQLNDRMSKEKRNILLLVDNVSSHRQQNELSNVTLQMLPPNTTSVLQPQDAGIIRAFKAAVRRAKNRHVVDKLDDMLQQAAASGTELNEQDAGSVLDVDVLLAMRWAQTAWSEVTQSTIANCWRHTRILDDDIYELMSAVERMRVSPPSLSQLPSKEV